MIMSFNFMKFLQIIQEFNVGPPYWVRDLPVSSGNPANVKNKKKTQNISQPKILFYRTSEHLYKRIARYNVS